jgi:hypothetical protein
MATGRRPGREQVAHRAAIAQRTPGIPPQPLQAASRQLVAYGEKA